MRYTIIIQDCLKAVQSILLFGVDVSWTSQENPASYIALLKQCIMIQVDDDLPRLKGY